MRRVFAVIAALVLLFPSGALGAVSFDNDKDCGSTNPCSYTSSGSNGFIEAVLGISTGGTTITVDGAPMMIAYSQTVTGAGTGIDAYIFTSAGTHSISVSGTDNGMAISSWNGVGSVDATSTGSLSCSTLSQSITPVASNTWATWMISNGDNGPTAISNVTMRISSNGSAVGIGDSNGTIPAGMSYTMQANCNGTAGAGRGQGTILTLAPVGGAPVAPIFWGTSAWWW